MQKRFLLLIGLISSSMILLGSEKDKTQSNATPRRPFNWREVPPPEGDWRTITPEMNHDHAAHYAQTHNMQPPPPAPAKSDPKSPDQKKS